jgi:hypothetical protein
MSRNNAGDGAGIVFLVCAGFVAFGAWQFSTALGVDFATGLSVFWRCLVLTLTAVVAWWAGRELQVFSLGTIWPILLAMLTVCVWPAVDYHATQAFPTFYQSEDTTVWWDAWYTKLGCIVAALAGGYAIRAWWNGRD